MFVAASCDKWLDVKPYDKISQDELLSTEEGFIKLLNGIYVELNSDILYGGALSVEMIEIMGGAYLMGTDKSGATIRISLSMSMAQSIGERV